MTRTMAAATTTSRSERLGWVAALCLSLTAGCSGCDDSSKAPSSSASAAAAELSPVPAPEGLIADLFVPAPGETWRGLRDTAGVALLPQSYGLLLATVLGLPLTVAEAFDDRALTVGGVMMAATGEPLVVLGAQVRSGPELIANLSTGDNARFDARRDDGSGLTRLVAKPGKASADVTLAVIGNRLLFSQSSEAMDQLGPYVGRSLHRRRVTGSGVIAEIAKGALRGPVHALVKQRWQSTRDALDVADRDNRQKRGGRTPDFGDPQAALLGLGDKVAALLEVLENADGARVTLESRAGVTALRAEVNPGSSKEAMDWVRGLSAGDARPLLSLPATTVLAIQSRSTAAARMEGAESTTASVSKLLAERLSPADAKKVSAALSQLAVGRGDDAVVGVLLGEPSGVVYRGSLSDPKAFDAGAKALFGLLELPAFKEPLRQFAGDMTVKRSTATVAGLPTRVERVLLTVKPSGMRLGADPSGTKAAAPEPIDVLWTVQDGVALGAVAKDAVPLLVTLSTATGDRTWAGSPNAAAAVERLGDRAAFVAAVRPGALLPRAESEAQGVATLALGKRESHPWLELVLDRESLRALVKGAILGR